MTNNYPTRLVRRITKATDNQLKYWVRIGLVCPARDGKMFFYSFKDIVKLRVLVSLRKKGLSLQKVRQGIKNLSEILPNDDPLSRLIIYTDGIDMIIIEKGKYFNAMTRQHYFRFDTEQIGAEIINLYKLPGTFPKKNKVYAALS